MLQNARRYGQYFFTAVINSFHQLNINMHEADTKQAANWQKLFYKCV